MLVSFKSLVNRYGFLVAKNLPSVEREYALFGFVLNDFLLGLSC